MVKKRASSTSASDANTLAALQARITELEGKKAPKSTTSGAKKQRTKRKQVAEEESEEESPDVLEASELDTSREILVRWSAKKQHYLTDKMLTIIEGSKEYRTAFGFNTAGMEGPSTKGASTIQLCRDLAHAVLVKDPSNQWTEDQLTELGESVKNRLSGTSGLKRSFMKHRDSLRSTGQGIIERGEEFQEGSELGNIWKKVLKKFPWYHRMHDLLSTSPVINADAMVNGATELDLGGILREEGGRGEEDVIPGPLSPNNLLDTNDIDNTPSDLDLDPTDHDFQASQSPNTPPRSKAAVPPPASATTAPAAAPPAEDIKPHFPPKRSQKVNPTLEALAKSAHDNQRTIAADQQKAHTDRSLALLNANLEAKERKRRDRAAFELAVYDKKIELARLQLQLQGSGTSVNSYNSLNMPEHVQGSNSNHSPSGSLSPPFLPSTPTPTSLSSNFTSPFDFSSSPDFVPFSYTGSTD